jgi:hypothetical protein
MGKKITFRITILATHKSGKNQDSKHNTVTKATGWVTEETTVQFFERVKQFFWLHIPTPLAHGASYSAGTSNSLLGERAAGL